MADETAHDENRTPREEAAANGVLLAGIDGGTPLGFLAALGLVRILQERGGQVTPKLSWQQLDAWRPSLHGPRLLDEVAEAVDEDICAWANSALLGFRYVKLEKKGPKAVGGLSAPLAVLRAWQIERRRARDERSLEYAAALMCDGTTETNKNVASRENHKNAGIAFSEDVPATEVIERTFFDFTARNAQFLEQVEEIRKYPTLDRIRAALERGEIDLDAPSKTRSLDWDPGADTPAAIYTGYRRGFLPVHEWLAFRGLVFLPLAGDGKRVRNTACSGRRLAGEFFWPLWTVPVGPDTLRSLVGYPGLPKLSVEARRALGVHTVLCADLTKKADNRSGTFSPARPV